MFSHGSSNWTKRTTIGKWWDMIWVLFMNRNSIKYSFVVTFYLLDEKKHQLYLISEINYNAYIQEYWESQIDVNVVDIYIYIYIRKKFLFNI